MRLRLMLGLLVVALSACRSPAEHAGPDLQLPCDAPEDTALGVPMLELPAYFTTTGGRLRVTVSDLPTGTIFGDITESQVVIGDAATRPTPDPKAPERPGNGRYTVTATLDEAGVIDVPAGSYWVVNTARGRIDLAACSDVTISEVRRADPDPGDPGSRTPTPSGS